MTNFVKKLFVLPLIAIVFVAFYGMNAKSSVLATPASASNKAVAVEVVDQVEVSMDELVDSLLKGAFDLEGLPSMDDSVWTIVNLKSETLYDSYRRSGLKVSFSEYLASASAKKQLADMRAEQEAVKAAILKINPSAKFDYSYTTVTNGFAACINYGDYAEVSAIDGVKNVDISVTYEIEARDDYDVNVVNAATLAGAKTSSNYRGQGMVIGILDTGLLTSHDAFSVDPDLQKFNYDYIDFVLEDTFAYYAMGGELTVDDVYVSGKVPFAFDYADYDSDVNPADFDEMFEYGNEHGTHVAGIAAGNNGSTFEGAAPDAQLAIFKVFSDGSGGASTMDIVAALNDALVLGVDVVNLSLGSACGFDYYVEETPYFQELEAAGIIACNSAGNSYNASMTTDYAYGTIYTPDQGTISSAGTYESTFAVASYATENQKESAIIIGGVACIFTEAVITQEPELRGNFVEQLVGSQEDVEFEWVYAGLGTETEVALADVENKIAVVLRGDISFAEKAYWCEQNGALACVIMNNVGGMRISPVIENVDFPVTIPVCSISLEDGLEVRASSDSSAHVGTEIYRLGGTLSEFSSWGPTPTLKLKPEITTYGGYVYSALATETATDYAFMSGTSMASPNMAGNVAVLKQAIQDKYYIYDLEYSELVSLIYNLLMSTATILVDSTNAVYYSPLRQGAGLINIDAALNAESYISVPGSSKAKIELGDDKDREGVYKLTFNVNNTASLTPKAFEIKPIVLTTSLQADSFQLDKTSTAIEDSTYKYVVRGGGELVDGNVVVVDAGDIATVTVTVTLSDEQKAFFDAAYPVGTYVDGFVQLIPQQEGSSLNVPFLTFYGDWDEAPLIDFDPELEDIESLAYNSTLYLRYSSRNIFPASEFWFATNFDVPTYHNDNIAINPKSNNCVWGIYSVYLGLLRNASVLTYSVVDKATGQELYSLYGTDIRKGHLVEGAYQPVGHGLSVRPYLANNTELEFVVRAEIPNGNTSSNLHYELRYPFIIDYETPYLEGSYMSAAQYVEEEEMDENGPAYITEIEGEDYLVFTARDNGYLYAYDFQIPTGNNRFTSLYGMVPFDNLGKGNKQTVYIPVSEFADNSVSNTFRLSLYDSALNGTTYTLNLRLFPLESVQFNEASYDVTVGGSVRTAVTLNPTYGYYDSVEYTSSDEDIATVSAAGVVTGVSIGTTTITVTFGVDGQEVSATTTISVTPAIGPDNVRIIDNPVIRLFGDVPEPEPQVSQTSIELDVSSLLLKVGESYHLQTQINLVDAHELNLSFESSDEEVATVDEEGNITALSEGYATITATLNGVSAECELIVKADNDEFIVVNGEVIGYTGEESEATLPEIVEVIPSFAFADDTTLVTLNIPSTVYFVEEDAFADSVIAHINFAPNYYIMIDDYAFYALENLESVVLPEGLTYLSDGLFYGSQNLTELVLPSTLKEIGNDALSYTGLSGELVLPDSVTYIGTSAFAGSEGITKLVLPSQLQLLANINYGFSAYLTSISDSYAYNPFFGLVGLEEFEISPDAKYFTTIDGVLYSKDLTNLVAYPTSKAGEDFVVPEGVTRISATAFYGTELKNVVIATTVMAIGDGAFLDSAIENVRFLGAIAPNLEAGYSSGVYVYYCNFAGSLAGRSGWLLFDHMSIEYPEDSYGYDARPYRLFFAYIDKFTAEEITALDEVLAEQTEEGVKLTLSHNELGATFAIARSLNGSQYEFIAFESNITEFFDDTAKAFNSEYSYLIYPIAVGYLDVVPGTPAIVTITRTGVSAELAQLIEDIKTVTANPVASNASLLRSAVSRYDALSNADKAKVGLGDQLFEVYADYLVANSFNVELAQESRPTTFAESYARYSYFAAAYAELSEAQTAFVSVGSILTGWKADLDAAQAFIRKVQFFGEVTIESGPALAALEAQYRALTPYQRQIVQATYDSSLASLQTRYSAILAEAHAEEVARNVENVTKMLEALPRVVTNSDKDLFDAAREAYNNLSEEEKALISSDLVAKLDDVPSAISPVGCTVTLGSIFVSAISALGLAAIFFKKRNY